MSYTLRIATLEDAPDINAIYGHYIAHSLANFGEENQTPQQRAGEIASLLPMYPYLVAQAQDGRVLGFACAEPYRPKTGYRYTAELTIYLSPDAPHHAGIGTALYELLLSCLQGQGFRVAVAVLYAQNQESLGLHRHFGFEQVGCQRHYCYKHGQWVDACVLEKVLNPFDNPPAPLIPFSRYRKRLRLP